MLLNWGAWNLSPVWSQVQKFLVVFGSKKSICAPQKDILSMCSNVKTFKSDLKETLKWNKRQNSANKIGVQCKWLNNSIFTWYLYRKVPSPDLKVRVGDLWSIKTECCFSGPVHKPDPRSAERTGQFIMEQLDLVQKCALAPYHLVLYKRNISILKSVLWHTASQSKDLRTGLMWSTFLVLVRTRVLDQLQLSDFLQRPVNTPLQ